MRCARQCTAGWRIMNTRPTITEEDLHAFIDGELDASRHDAIEHLLNQDATLAQRVAKFREDKDRLASIYAPLLERPIPRGWDTRIRQSQKRSARRNEMAAVTAIAASLVLVIGGLWLVSPPSPPQTRSLVSEALAARSGNLQPDMTVSSGVDAHSAGREISMALAMRAKAPMLTRFGYRLASIKSYEADSKR